MTLSSSIYFTEDMHGFVGNSGQGTDISPSILKKSYQHGKVLGQSFKFRVTVFIDDIDDFINDPNLEANLTGYIDSPLFGGRQEISNGIFNLFVYPDESTEFNAAKEMHYSFEFQDNDSNHFYFKGFKVLHKQNLDEAWTETTTLFTKIYKDKDESELFCDGILRLNLEDFLKQLTTFDSNAGSFLDKIETYYKFLDVFASKAWQAYTPQIFNPEKHQWDKHVFPVHTMKGVSDCKITHHFVDTSDGLTIQFDRFYKRKSKDIIILLHGLSSSTDMYIMPEHYNLVQYLINNGYEDVVSIDWRGSGRHKYNYIPSGYNIDYVAKYDLPEALKQIKNLIGEDCNYHIISHCVGSISAAASLSSGQLSGIKSWIANSVSFNPQIPKLAYLKISFAPFLLDNIFRYPYLSPQIPYLPGFGFAKWISLMERLIRRECDEPGCHMVSFMWGWGFPAAYEHKNLHVLTHRRIKDIFGATTTSYFRHLRKMIKLKETVPYQLKEQFYDLPKSYYQSLKHHTLPPTLLIAGKENRIFPGSNKLSFNRIQKDFPGQEIKYLEFEGYGHQDIFIGKNSATDIFPSILDFLNKHREK